MSIDAGSKPSEPKAEPSLGEFAANADSPVYLDHNATTPVAPEVFEAMRPWLTEAWGNPSSAHVYGRRAAGAVAEAREQVASLIGANPDEIIFTSCGTEADNLALLGWTAPDESSATVLSSSMEHPAIEKALERLAQRAGWSWRRLETSSEGTIVLDEAALGAVDLATVDLATVMLAHNETGAVQPIGELVEALRSSNSQVVVHTDAAQAVGKIEVKVDELGVDMLTMVGHKFGAPKGVAALYRRRGVALQAQLVGGGQEGGLRSGTEAVAQVVALGAACELATQTLIARVDKFTRQRELLWGLLSDAIDGLHRTVQSAPLLPNTLHVCVAGQDGRAFLAATPQVAASTGSACHASSEHVPGILGQMSLSADLAKGALRLSLGLETTDQQIRQAAAALALTYRSFS